MARIAAKEASKTVTIVETTEVPVRANASIVRVGDEMILFGGEYFDGAVNFCYDDVYRYNIVRVMWSLGCGCSEELVLESYSWLFADEKLLEMCVLSYFACATWQSSGTPSAHWMLCLKFGNDPTTPHCQAVVYKDSMFVHGGEFATANQYYHHRDIWRFQLSDNS
jgi:Galactose oxidase, central domain